MRLEVRVLAPADEAEALALHRREFGDSRDAAWWAWRFRGLPGGRSKLVGAFAPSGRCRALYAGLWQPLWIDGRVGMALIHSDIAVDGELRDGLGGAALLRRATREFMVDVPDDDTRVMYGFPQPGLLRFLVREVNADVLGDVLFLVREASSAVPAPPSVVVSRVEEVPTDVDELWARVRDEVGAALVRDRDYLDWRFARHPLVDYELVECRDARSGELRGFAALREGGWDPQIASLSEWLVPQGDADADAALVAHALAYAERRDRRYLVGWFSSADPRFDGFQVTHGFAVKATPYQQLVISYTQGVDRAWLREYWYQTMGDIDFF